jgi:hypothetical protein
VLFQKKEFKANRHLLTPQTVSILEIKSTIFKEKNQGRKSLSENGKKTSKV